MDKNFKNDVSNRPGGENITLCYSCGSCTATCPVSEVDDTFNPRLIIKKTLLGCKEEVLDNDDLWKCIQCRRCVSHCPQNVKFADIMRVLRDMSIEEGYYDKEVLTDIEANDKELLKYRLNNVDQYLNDDTELKVPDSGGDKNG